MSVLDLFKGQLSLETILSIPIPFLKELYESRIKLIEEQEKAKADAINRAASQRSNDSYY